MQTKLSAIFRISYSDPKRYTLFIRSLLKLMIPFLIRVRNWGTLSATWNSSRIEAGIKFFLLFVFVFGSSSFCLSCEISSSLKISDSIWKFSFDLNEAFDYSFLLELQREYDWNDFIEDESDVSIMLIVNWSSSSWAGLSNFFFELFLSSNKPQDHSLWLKNASLGG